MTQPNALTKQHPAQRGLQPSLARAAAQGVAVCCALLILPACAELPKQAANGEFQDGWRMARVESLQPLAGDSTQVGCHHAQSQASQSGPRVLVSYSWGGSATLRSKRLVHLPAGTEASQNIKVGDKVRVNITDCQAPLRTTP